MDPREVGHVVVCFAILYWCTLLAAQLLFYRSYFAQCAEEKRQQDFGAENSSASYATTQYFELLHILCYYTLRIGGGGGANHEGEEFEESEPPWD